MMAGSELAQDAPSTAGDLGSAMARVREMRIVGAYGPKPVWRGRIHQVAFFVSLPAGLWLLAGATTAAARVAVAVYWASMAGLFFTSSTYHLFAHSENAVKWWRRADHSMIFVLIAGSYTPFCLLVLPRVWGIPMLVVMWVTALAGIIMKMVRVTAAGGKSGSWLYVVMGWAAMIALPQLVSELGFGRMLLMFGGGILYTVGAVILGKRWLNFSPAVFGYHEVWHALTVGAGVCHFTLVAMIVR
ncbi:MAG: hemolysin III family protein [Microthrixaceae bacterium]|jgi:hemolysin III